MGQGKIDFVAINRAALNDFKTLLEEWLPEGRWDGHEYKATNPRRHDTRIGSFSINANKGVWSDFATDDKGSDPISLYAYLFTNDDQGAAAKKLAARLGIDAPAPNSEKRAPAVTASTITTKKSKKENKPVWTPIHPAPDTAPPPPAAHYVRGRPERSWRYLDANGKTIGYVYRFVTSDGGKETLPVCWARCEDGRENWRWLSFQQPRTLYGLDRLARDAKATVLMVEGEKCADAGQAELPDLVSMSWPGGSKAVDKADFSPLAKRKVILWPDCDAQREKCSKAEVEQGVAPESKPLLPENEQSGIVAMNKVAAKLHALKCEVWLVKIPKPGEKPSGWDIADAIAEGLRGDDLTLFIRGNLVRYEPLPAPASDRSSTPQQAAASVEYGADDSWRGLLLRKDDRLIDCRENVYLLLQHHPAWKGALWADEFARKIVKRRPAPWESARDFEDGAEWKENDDLRMGLWLAQQERLIVRSTENLNAATGWIASESRWHPVREYLDHLVWDREPRLDSWLTDFLGVAKTEYSRLVGTMFLIGMAARIYRPGCTLRTMPILEGPQFQGKSTSLRILGGRWFGDTPLDLNSKDAYQNIQGCWLYEIAELDSFNRAESTRVKSFVSSTKDRFRAPYDRAPRDWERQGVFAGTTNQDEYFKDATGNTRYWPLVTQAVDEINLEGLEKARDQLFAEAVFYYKRGERWHPTREEQREHFDAEQAARELIDPWEEIVHQWLVSHTRQRVTVSEVLTEGLRVDPAKIDSARQMATRVGVIMHRLGWKKERETGGSRGYYYTRPAGSIGVEDKSGEMWGGDDSF